MFFRVFIQRSLSYNRCCLLLIVAHLILVWQLHRNKQFNISFLIHFILLIYINVYKKRATIFSVFVNIYKLQIYPHFEMTKLFFIFINCLKTLLFTIFLYFFCSCTSNSERNVLSYLKPLCCNSVK